MKNKWPIVEIKDIAQVKRGASPRPISDSKYFASEGRGWVRIADVTRTYKYLNNTTQYLSELGEQASVKVEPNDLIMSICATVGKPVLVGIPACIHDGFVVFRDLNESKLTKEYFFYQLLLLEDKWKIKGQTGSQMNLNTTLVKHTKIVLPTLTTQEKIGDILSSIDEAIQKTDQIILKSEELKNGLMNELLTKGIGYKKFKKTKLGEIPENWEVSALGENAIHVGSGSTPRGGSKVYLKSGIPLIRSQNVHFERLDLSDVVYISPETHEVMSRSKLLKNDILLNITGASLGRVNIVPEYFEQGNVNQHVCIIRVKKAIYPLYLKYYLESTLGQKQIFKYQIGGNREGLNFKQVRALTMVLPPIKEQKAIVEVIESVNTKIIQERLEENKCILLKKGLMQDIFNQKVKIN